MAPGPSISTPSSSRAVRVVRVLGVGFVAGLLLALLTSVGIAGERVTAGNPVLAIVANAAATLAAILALLLTLRARRLAPAASAARPLLIALPQLAGAALGVACVHLALAGLAPRELDPSRVLVERPAQFVNDGVAVLAILAVVWGASTRPLGAAGVIAGAALVTLYAATATRWHVDPITFRAATIQQFVAAQFIAGAIAVGVYRWVAFERR